MGCHVIALAQFSLACAASAVACAVPLPVLTTQIHRRLRELIGVRDHMDAGTRPPDLVKALTVPMFFDLMAVRLNADQDAGIAIVRRALQEPVRQIANNAGAEGSVVVAKILENPSNSFGYHAATGEYGDLVARGVTTPAKVGRTRGEWGDFGFYSLPPKGPLVRLSADRRLRPQEDGPVYERRHMRATPPPPVGLGSGRVIKGLLVGSGGSDGNGRATHRQFRAAAMPGRRDSAGVSRTSLATRASSSPDCRCDASALSSVLPR